MALQILITLALIIIATTIVGHRIRQMFSKSSPSGCGSCNGCSGGNSSAAIKVTPLVQLGTTWPNKT